MDSRRIGVLGGSGFIGSHVVAYGRSLGMDVTPVPMIRVSTPDASVALDTASIEDRAHDWCHLHNDAFTELCRVMEPFEVLVNAAGLARPRSADQRALFSANALQPAVVAHAAGAAGIRRLVHISTAGVQGRLDPLDETLTHLPLSPYAVSKSAGERFLLESSGRDDLPPEIILYRPTSVHGLGRQTTLTFARLVRRLPAVPINGAGETPVPVALIENVAAGIVFAAHMAGWAPIILQPCENMSTASLLTTFGVRRFLHLPPRPTTFLLDRLAHFSADAPRVASQVRWLELLLLGQSIEAGALAKAGFRLAAGSESWQALADQTRV